MHGDQFESEQVGAGGEISRERSGECGSGGTGEGVGRPGGGGCGVPAMVNGEPGEGGRVYPGT